MDEDKLNIQVEVKGIEGLLVRNLVFQFLACLRKQPCMLFLRGPATFRNLSPKNALQVSAWLQNWNEKETFKEGILRNGAVDK